MDTTTSGGKLIFHIFGALAEFERNLIRERTLAGLEATRSRGRKGGRRNKLTFDQVDTLKKNARLKTAQRGGDLPPAGNFQTYLSSLPEHDLSRGHGQNSVFCEAVVCHPGEGRDPGSLQLFIIREDVYAAFGLRWTADESG